MSAAASHIEAAERRIRCDGVDLRVLSEGPASAPPLLLLHGFTGSLESLDAVAAELRGDYRVHRMDLVGHGASEAPCEVSAYRMRRCVAQLAALHSALSDVPAHWLGYSMGGRAALALACAHPQRVRSLVLVGASAGVADPGARRERQAADAALAQRIEREGVPAFVEHWMTLPLFASQKRLGPAALERARAQRLRNSAHGLANSLRGMGSGAQQPLHPQLAQLRPPALWLAGSEDPKFRAIAAESAARMPRAWVAVVPEAGHAAHLENPEAFLRLTRDFLRQVEARP